MLTRRSLMAGAAALGATLILPPTLAENAEAARRYWALDQTMSGSTLRIPRDSHPWFLAPHVSERWRIFVYYPDGGAETHFAPTPERELKLRIARRDSIAGAAIYNADTSRLEVIYGHVPLATLKAHESRFDPF